MVYITCENYGPTYVPAYVLGEYLRKYTKTKFYLYVYVGDETYKKEPFHNYVKRKDFRNSVTNGSYMHDFISFQDLGETYEFDGYRIDDCEHYAYIGSIHENWCTDESVADIIDKMPANFLHSLNVYQIPKGSKYRLVDYDGSVSLELEHEIEWQIAT